jgi:hypothetical protein
MRPEDALQQQVCSYLERALPRTSYWCAIPNGAVLAGDKVSRARQMAKLKRTGLRPGAPDLIVLHDGRLLAIELKVASGKLSDAQKESCDAIVQAGGGYAVCRSVEEVESYLAGHGVPLRARMLSLRIAA